MVFSDRVEAGELLAQALQKYQKEDVVVFGLPRGGVVVAAEVAKSLHKPLDLIIIRKIGHPYNPEYALCAASLNNIICNEEELKKVDRFWFNEELTRQRKRANEQYELYLGGRKPLSAKDKIVVLVDDGIATGLTIKAAIQEIQEQSPEKIVIAVPVIPRDTFEELKKEAEVVTLEIPEYYAGSVGAYYDFFPQVTDDEVIKLLSLARTNLARLDNV